MKTAFLAGRVLVAGFYLFNGVNLFLKRAMAIGFAASKGVPFPEVAVPVAASLLLIGGLSLLLGWKPAVGIGAIVLFLAPVTIYMHAFWNETGAAQLNDMGNFAKNIALLGAALMLSAIPRPWIASVESSRKEELAEPEPARQMRRAI